MAQVITAENIRDYAKMFNSLAEDIDKGLLINTDGYISVTKGYDPKTKRSSVLLTAQAAFEEPE